MMKKLSFWILLPVVLLVVTAKSQVEETDRQYTLTVDASYWSRYIRWGFDLNDGRPVFQPSIMSELPLGFSVEVSAFIGSERMQLDEVDAALSFQQAIIPKLVHMSVSFYDYEYVQREESNSLTGNGSPSSSQEIIVGLSTQSIPVDVSLEFGRGLGAKDENNNGGNYFGASLGKDFEIGQTILSSVLSAVYLDQYEIPKRITELSLENSLSFDVGGLTMQPKLSFVYLPEPELLNESDEDKIILWGMSISYGW